MNSVLVSWLDSDYHKGLISKYQDVCFVLLGGSIMGGYVSVGDLSPDYDVDYWTLESFDCDILSKYYYDEGDAHTHIDLYVHPLSCKFGKTVMMGYFNTINWRNLKKDSPIWVNTKYQRIWDYCFSVKDDVSKAGMSVMIDRCSDFIKGVYDGTLVVKSWNKNVYRLCGLCEDLGLASKDFVFLLSVKKYWSGLSKEDELRVRAEVKLVYDFMSKNQIPWKSFRAGFVQKIEDLRKECEL